MSWLFCYLAIHVKKRKHQQKVRLESCHSADELMSAAAKQYAWPEQPSRAITLSQAREKHTAGMHIHTVLLNILLTYATVNQMHNWLLNAQYTLLHFI